MNQSSSPRSLMFTGLTSTKQLCSLGPDPMRKKLWLVFRERNEDILGLDEDGCRARIAKFLHVEGSAVTREQVREVVLRCRKIASDKKYRAARASSSGVGTMESVGVQTDDLHSLSCSECEMHCLHHVMELKEKELSEMKTLLLLKQLPSPKRQRSPVLVIRTPTCTVRPTRSRVASTASSASSHNLPIEIGESTIEARVRIANSLAQKRIAKPVKPSDIFRHIAKNHF